MTELLSDSVIESVPTFIPACLIRPMLQVGLFPHVEARLRHHHPCSPAESPGRGRSRHSAGRGHGGLRAPALDPLPARESLRPMEHAIGRQGAERENRPPARAHDPRRQDRPAHALLGRHHDRPRRGQGRLPENDFPGPDRRPLQRRRREAGEPLPAPRRGAGPAAYSAAFRLRRHPRRAHHLSGAACAGLQLRPRAGRAGRAHLRAGGLRRRRPLGLLAHGRHRARCPLGPHHRGRGRGPVSRLGPGAGLYQGLPGR